MTGKSTRLDVTSSARLWQCQSTRMGTGGGGAVPLASSGRSWNAGCSYQVVAALDVEAAALLDATAAGVVVAALAFAAAVVNAAGAAWATSGRVGAGRGEGAGMRPRPPLPAHLAPAAAPWPRPCSLVVPPGRPGVF